MTYPDSAFSRFLQYQQANAGKIPLQPKNISSQILSKLSFINSSYHSKLENLDPGQCCKINKNEIWFWSINPETTLKRRGHAGETNKQVQNIGRKHEMKVPVARFRYAQKHNTETGPKWHRAVLN
jgi:hypothetical protein